MRDLTAVLKFNNFQAKMKMVERLPIIKIPVQRTLKLREITQDILDISPIMVFEWHKQIGKYTHLYYLKEIEQ